MTNIRTACKILKALGEHRNATELPTVTAQAILHRNGIEGAGTVLQEAARLGYVAGNGDADNNRVWLTPAGRNFALLGR